MNKILIFLCAAAMLAAGTPVFAEEVIPDYEPWKYMITAAVGSCSKCDPNYTFKYNHELRMQEYREGQRAMDQTISDLLSGNNPLKGMSAADLLMIGAITTAATLIVFAVMFEESEYIKTSY